MPRVFLLSPPNCAGLRAQVLLHGRSRTEVAAQLDSPAGAVLGDVGSYLSSLYFRGKLAYARAFAAPPPGVEGKLMITPDRGLLSVEARISLADLRGFAGVPIDLRESRYVEPLQASARLLLERIGPGCEVVLLGSIATAKYIDCLLPIFGEALLFPADFVGRGDMSRGGLLLRHAARGEELRYQPIRDAVRKGQRPPRLAPAR